MNQVLSSYFDDAHRGLQRQKSGGSGKSGVAAANVQLPPLTPDGVSPSTSGMERDASGWEQVGGSGRLMQSSSMGSLGLSHEQVRRGVETERYQQALQDNSRLSKKLRATQEQLSITTAKKEAFKAQAQRLEKEFKKGREQADTLQKELLEAKRDAEQYTKESQEAVHMMSDMRKAHLHEVRLLQRGLAARSGDEKFRNRVNEVADLVDKLGRSVVQRDEAIRDKTRIQAQHNKMSSDLRALMDECGKLRKQNRELDTKLKEAVRKGKYKPPKVQQLELDESDEEFEIELISLEKRFQILEEGPMGLDILASNLSKDKLQLEKALKQEQDMVAKLTSDVTEWRKICNEKDEHIADLQSREGAMIRQQAQLQEQVDMKKREIEEKVNDERAKLEKKMAELETDRDEALATAQTLEKASDCLSKELVKVHGQYAEHHKADTDDPDYAEPAEEQAAAHKTDTDEPEGEAATAAEASVQTVVPKLVAKQEQQARTGEVLHMEVYRPAPGGAPDSTELQAHEVPDGQEFRVPLTEEMLRELDTEDPWTELFSRVGVSAGPPKNIVVSSLLGKREVNLPPTDARLLLTVYRYDARRFFVEGMQVDSGAFADLAIKEDSLTPELASQIDGCLNAAGGAEAVVDFLAGRLSFEDDRLFFA